MLTRVLDNGLRNRDTVSLQGNKRSLFLSIEGTEYILQENFILRQKLLLTRLKSKKKNLKVYLYT